MSLKGSKTEKNLKEAFAREAQANRRFFYFASKADVEDITKFQKSRIVNILEVIYNNFTKSVTWFIPKISPEAY